MLKLIVQDNKLSNFKYRMIAEVDEKVQINPYWKLYETIETDESIKLTYQLLNLRVWRRVNIPSNKNIKYKDSI